MFKKKLGLILLAISILAAVAHPQTKEPGVKDRGLVYNTLPGYGKKCWIEKDYYFVYKFDKPPKMGAAILKVQLFDKKGKRNTGLSVIGNYGMPSMKGAHDSGDQPFQLNKKGDYLLPVNIAMPGEWEVKLTFMNGVKKVIYLGKFRFNV